MAVGMFYNLQYYGVEIHCHSIPGSLYTAQSTFYPLYDTDDIFL